jgi:hypothetical protein
MSRATGGSSEQPLRRFGDHWSAFNGVSKIRPCPSFEIDRGDEVSAYDAPPTLGFGPMTEYRQREEAESYACKSRPL